MTRDELIDKVRDVAARLGRTAMTLKEFTQASQVSDYWTTKHFECWANLCSAAGIEPGFAYGLSDDQVFAAMRDAFDRMGGIGTSKRFENHFRYTMAVLRARWPDWVAALAAFRDWALAHDPGFPYLDDLERRIAQGAAHSRRTRRDLAPPAPPTPPARRAAPDPGAPHVAPAVDAPADPPPAEHGDAPRDAPRDAQSEPTPGAPAESPPPDAHRDPLPDARVGAAGDATRDPAPAAHPGAAPDPAASAGSPDLADAAGIVGETIAYRGIVYAPTNEMGVVMLFAVAAEALGFAIESSRTAFPDCIAVQRVAPGRYRRLRIEFEYASSNFRAHRHDPKGCDLVVCWHHDWPACPVKVLDLKKEIARLRKG